MAYALDTNCILRWLICDVVAQAEKIENLLSTSKTKVLVLDEAILEAVWVMEKIYEYDDQLICGLIEKLVTHKNIESNSALFLNVTKSFRLSPRASYIDVYLAQRSDTEGKILKTFDKTLAKKLPKLVEIV